MLYFKKKNVLSDSIGCNLSICKLDYRGKVIYIRISPHPAEAGIIWELLLLV